jgi:glycosyltransferase involved in cell wall biosynthesis
MRIVLATPVYPPEIGGPATYTKELAERLHEAHEIVIVAYASTSENVPGTTLITVNKRQPLLVRLVKYTVKLFLATKGAGVIYVQNGVAAGLPALIVGKLRRIPVVLKFVGDEAWERATQLRLTQKSLEAFLKSPEGNFRIRLIMMLQGVVLRGVDAVTTPSKYLGEAIVEAYGIDPKRFHVNYNAAEAPDVLPFESQSVPHQVVVTARLVEWKGIAGVIRAVASLVDDFPDIQLLIAGDGPEEERLQQLVQKLSVGSHVTFLGRVSRAETCQSGMTKLLQAQLHDSLAMRHYERMSWQEHNASLRKSFRGLRIFILCLDYFSRWSRTHATRRLTPSSIEVRGSHPSSSFALEISAQVSSTLA